MFLQSSVSPEASLALHTNAAGGMGRGPSFAHLSHELQQAPPNLPLVYNAWNENKNRVNYELWLTNWLKFNYTQTGKTTTIRLTSVWETSVSRHHGRLMEGAPECTRPWAHYDIGKFNPFVPTVAFSQLSSNMCCPRVCVSRTANVGWVSKNGLTGPHKYG